MAGKRAVNIEGGKGLWWNRLINRVLRSLREQDPILPLIFHKRIEIINLFVDSKIGKEYKIEKFSKITRLEMALINSFSTAICAERGMDGLSGANWKSCVYAQYIRSGQHSRWKWQEKE